jgi:hypothetical protein
MDFDAFNYNAQDVPAIIDGAVTRKLVFGCGCSALALDTIDANIAGTIHWGRCSEETRRGSRIRRSSCGSVT